MISLIIEHMIGLTDAVFLGRVGDVALGACALGGVYYMAMFMLAFGFGFGAQIIIARRNGERRYNRIAPTMVQGCYFMLVLAVALFAASQYFSPIILRDIIESPQVYGATADYLREEIDLVKSLTEYPSVVKSAGENFAPSVVGAYVYELAKQFNGYYHDHSILKEENAGVRTMRLQLAQQVARVIKEGMKLLGIDVPERM